MSQALTKEQEALLERSELIPTSEVFGFTDGAKAPSPTSSKEPRLRLLDENGKRFEGEWGVSKLGSICSLKTGKKDVNEGDPNGEYPFFTCASEPSRSGDYSYDCEALLIAGNGSVGKTQYYNGKFEAYQRTYILSNFSESIGFLFQYVSTMLPCSISKEVQHGAMPYIKMGFLQNFKVPIPTLPEQQKIAALLSSLDRRIELMTQKHEQLKVYKKGLMQQLLTGKVRLLDENGKRFEGEWKKTKLGLVSEMNSGGTPKSSVSGYYGGNIPWVSIADMTKHGKWIFSTEKKLTQLGLDNSSARMYPVNTVLYAMYASIGECSIAQTPVCSSQAILGIRAKEMLHYEFLYFFLFSLKEKIKLQGQQGTQANLNMGMVKDFDLFLPPLPEQQKIAALLSSLDRRIELAAKQIDEAKAMKKGLMQGLFV